MSELQYELDALTAENARLRAEVKDAKRLRADDLANLATVHAALFRALGLAGCGANTPPLDCIRMLVDRHKADLARVTGERDAYIAQWDSEVAGKMALRREHGARDDETWADFIARVTGERDGIARKLVRMTAERDGLLRAARDVLAGQVVPGAIFPASLTQIDALRAAVSSCAPPASGEPPAPQRFWRVVGDCNCWYAATVREDGSTDTTVHVIVRPTCAEAEKDGIDSGLEEWKP